MYLDKKVESLATTKHRVKFGMVEDAFNKRWKELVTYRLHITFDKNRVAGWYKSSITIGPEPKPIRTGATLSTFDVRYVWPLATYKLHVCTCSGREDEEMNRITKNVEGNSKQKFINLLVFFANFMGCGHIATMASAYMGELAAQVG